MLQPEHANYICNYSVDEQLVWLRGDCFRSFQFRIMNVKIVCMVQVTRNQTIKCFLENDKNNNEYSDHVWVTFFLALIAYSFAILLLVYNTKRYLIDQRRYKDSGSMLLTFYIFMAFVLFLRTTHSNYVNLLHEQILKYVSEYSCAQFSSDSTFFQIN